MDHSSTLPPLESLRAFEAAARTGSFSAAAASLNLTHGAVSRQVARLEHWLGLRVFQRQARGVALTSEGQHLLQRTQEAFALIADTSDRWREQRGAAVVRVSAPPSICSLWLMPRLEALEGPEPMLRIVLQAEHRRVDFEEEGVDLGIRCGRGGAPGRISLKLFEEWCFPIASPKLAALVREGAPERLLAHPLIHDSDAAGWRAWFSAQGLDYRPRPQDRRFDDYNIVLDAAAHGLGVALARPPLAQEQVASGRLVRVDERTALNPVAYWLDRPMGAPRPAAETLSRRIASEAGVTPETIAAFLEAEARAS
ncbi:MAG TPA: LysR substrate-binding domain-containing protein [Bosea sp. (in: a-proteobacteria)]|jgi:DNA-binding transcriptional LysR family regulator|uniref:LysR substrate-binding domain-containing protein n=1 Tax=Bosea sp. (in: a-proteobacteria) TaxID=1871050 RepID=UPI002E13A6AA|nr:LysR substrate-binding domain-containing protein [Bosea sp. (in: a-proteobacteria)]